MTRLWQAYSSRVCIVQACTSYKHADVLLCVGFLALTFKVDQACESMYVPIGDKDLRSYLSKAPGPAQFRPPPLPSLNILCTFNSHQPCPSDSVVENTCTDFIFLNAVLLANALSSFFTVRYN